MLDTTIFANESGSRGVVRPCAAALGQYKLEGHNPGLPNKKRVERVAIWMKNRFESKNNVILVVFRN